jgi:prephenate dehydrogenase
METFIIGLGETGASLSLALNASGANVSCTGYDPAAQIARKLRKEGQIDRIVFSPRKASQTADIIFMTVSADLVKEYLEIIGPTLKKGAVILDMSSLKSAAMTWASEILREDTYYIGAVPVINPSYLEGDATEPALPNADMFRNGLLALAIPPNTPENVIELTYAIANILGANPFFIDPAEIDAVTATVEQLPALVSITLIQLGLRAPIWREIQQMAGRHWSKSTIIGVKHDPLELSESIKLNNQNVVYKLDALIEELERMRSFLIAEDDEALTNYITESNSAFHSWLSDRKLGKLSSPELKVPPVPRSDFVTRLLGTGKSKFKR